MPCRCRAPPPRRRRCRWCSRPSRSTTTAASATTRYPDWVKVFVDSPNPPRPAARAIRSLKSRRRIGDSGRRPYLHLVDGGVSDNLGMRTVLDALEVLEALHEAGIPTPLDSARRIIVFIVDSVSSPPTNWDESETAARNRGHPAQVRRHADRCVLLRSGRVAERHGGAVANEAPSPQFRGDAQQQGVAVAAALRVPEAEIYAIDVSFAALKDKAELRYLNRQPTTFVLPPEAVDRLRAAAGTIILESPEFKRLLKDAGAKVVGPSPAGGRAAAGPGHAVRARCRAALPALPPGS